MALTVVQMKSAKPKEKAYKLADGRGLYLLVNPNGSKLWKLKYRFAGIEKKLSLGAYPEVSLAAAREAREDARKQLVSSIDPGVLKNSIKRSKKLAAENSFEAIAREWHAKFSSKWTKEHGERILIRLEQNIFPWVGRRPILEVTAPELLSALRRVEARGAIETAHRILQICGQVFRYGIATGRAERNLSADLIGALAPVKKKHHASITDPAEVGKLLRAINGYEGFFVTKCALQLAPLFFVRPGELRRAEWDEFDFEKAEWRIPAEKMKMREMHIVPLCSQAITILQELKAFTGEGKYVFPGIRSSKRPMSENTVLGALRRLGYTTDEMTGHGFRSMASTLLNEQGWNRDAIERQLAHAERNNIRAAYNYAEYLPERRKMMQHWADYLDELIGVQMQRIKSAKDLPSWFKIEKYKIASDFTATKWYEQLFARKFCMEIGGDNSCAKKALSDIRENVAININNPQYSLIKTCSAFAYELSFQPGAHPMTAHEFASLECAIHPDKIHPARRWIRQNHLNPDMPYTAEIDKPLSLLAPGFRKFIAFAVNPRIPKPLIMKQFEEFLDMVWPPEYIEKRYQKKELQSWHIFGILPFIDLKTWAAENDMTISNRIFADALFFDAERGEENVRKTTAVLADRLLTDESLDELAAQALIEILQ